MNRPENGQVGKETIDEICKLWATVSDNNDTILKVWMNLLLGQSTTEGNCWGL